MMSDVAPGLFLAESDWQTVVAIVVFSLISIVANWVKKRSDAAGSKPRTSGDDEFEPVVLFEEPKPVSRPTPVARPTTPPIPVAKRGRSEPRGKSVKASEHTSEAQVRIASKLRTPTVPLTHAMQGSAKVSNLRQKKPSAPQQAAEVEDTLKKPLDISDFRNPRTLRQAVVAAELLRPPVALRNESDLPGLSMQI
jgi:hypothetical protein